jgi:HMG (high mobility group) box
VNSPAADVEEELNEKNKDTNERADDTEKTVVDDGDMDVVESDQEDEKDYMVASCGHSDESDDDDDREDGLNEDVGTARANQPRIESISTELNMKLELDKGDSLPPFIVSDALLRTMREVNARASDPSRRPDVDSEGRKIPRPCNSFILYRRSKHEEVKKYLSKKLRHNPANDIICKEIGNRWGKESNEVKNYFRIKAEEEKYKHSLMYPDYKYKPQRKL